MAGDTRHIYQSLVTNLAIAVSKGVAAAFTGSGAMLAETLHSLADCGNQGLLLLGVKQAQRPPDAAHPLGYGRSLYFWSFMVALLLFTGGGVFSMYEGTHKLLHPERVEKVWLAVAILLFSVVLEGAATYANLREIGRRRGAIPLARYLRETKDSDLVVLFGENAAATLGLVLALASIGMAVVTGDARWDGIGTIGIGVVLIAVAVFLAVEVKSLLVGEAAGAAIEAAARRQALANPRLAEVLSPLTVQQGPGEVLVAMKIRGQAETSSRGVCSVINAFDTWLRALRPQVRWCLVGPDHPEFASTPEVLATTAT